MVTSDADPPRSDSPAADGAEFWEGFRTREPSLFSSDEWIRTWQGIVVGLFLSLMIWSTVGFILWILW